MTKDKIFIGADTATSITINNDIYRRDNNARKLYLDKDKVIFCAGWNPLSHKIMKDYFNSESRTIKSLKNVMEQAFNNKSIREDFKKQNIILNNDEEINKDYTVGTMIATFKNNFPIVYGVSTVDLNINTYNLMDQNGITLYTLGMKDDECRQKAIELLKSGYTIADTFIKAFEYASYEGVGGILHAYEINKNNEIKPFIHVCLNESPNIKKVIIGGNNMLTANKEQIKGSVIEADSLYVKSANITGTIVADTVRSNWIYTGKITADQIDGRIARLADGIEIGNPANATGKSIKFGTGASITTKPSTLGPSIVLDASEVELPSVTCSNLHIDGNLSGVDYASSGHTHGNTYVKSQTGQNISFTVTDIGVVVRLNGNTIGSLMFV